MKFDLKEYAKVSFQLDWNIFLFCDHDGHAWTPHRMLWSKLVVWGSALFLEIFILDRELTGLNHKLTNRKQSFDLYLLVSYLLYKALVDKDNIHIIDVPIFDPLPQRYS